jgi:hypothetical protein
VALITINRPAALNALTPESARALGKAWERFRDDAEAWAAVITGAGEKAFCVGYEMSPEALALEGAKASVATIPTHFDITKPVIAAINGYCVAGGWWIAQECDLRVAVETAQFGITQVKWGLMPAFTATLSRHLLPGHALELLLTGKRISARRAYERCPLTLAGIRSLCPEEHDFIRKDDIPVWYWDPNSSPDSVLDTLSDTVYVSVDLDVLDPALMPAVGTPEPGGMTWHQLVSLLSKVAKSRRIVGFDVCELAPADGPPACSYTAAKLVYKLVALACGKRNGMP